MKKSKLLIILPMIMALFLGSAYVLPSQGTAGPLSEGFEGTFPPDGWLVVNNDGGTQQWSQTSVYAHTGTYSTRCRYETYSLDNDDWLITPKLSVVANDTLKFWFRTYSSTAESIEVRLSTTTSSLDQFTNVLWATQIGTSTWTEKLIDLTTYAGQEVYIAFVYKSAYEWYFYIDDVTGPDIVVAGDDMATQSIDNPSDGASLEGNSSISVQATVKNAGSNTQSSVPVHLEIDDGAGYTYTDVEYTGTLNQDDTEQITFSPDWTVPNAFGSYTIKVWTALAKADGNPDNDTVTINVSAVPEGYTVESFENTLFPPEGWARGPGTSEWIRSSGSAHTGSYKARARDQNAWLFTPQLAVGTGDVLKYWYRSESASYATSFYVRLSTSASQEDTSAYTTILADHQNITSTTYAEGVIDLSPYARLNKGQVYIAFHRYYGASNYWYLYLDDVTLPPIYVPAGDMATISIDNPSDGAALQGNSSVSVQATVKNVGIDPQSSVPVHLEITDGGAKYTYKDTAYTGTLNQDDTEQITFDPDWTVPNVFANYTIKVWTALAKADGNPDNDTVTISVSAMPEGYTVESFEDLPFPPPGWDMGPGTNDWARSSYSAHTGSYKARARGQNAWLFTPPLKVESGDALRFWYRAESSSHPTSFYVRLSTSPDQSDTTGYTTFLADYPNITSTTYLEGNIDLSPYKGIVYIAFHRYYCDVDYYYLYLDDVALPPFPIQIVVSPDSFYIESFPDETFDDYLYIGNLGGGQLDYDIYLETTVGWFSFAPTSGSALGGEEDTITLSFNTAGLDGHYYNTLSIISNSDMKGVDTVLVPVHLWVRLIPEISISPDSFAVGVEGNSTKDTSMFISNTGNGDLEYSIETEEWEGKAIYTGEPATRPHKVDVEEWAECEKKGAADTRRGIPPSKGTGGPDAFGYRWVDSDEPGGPTYSWVEINSVGTQFDLTDDDNDGPYPIGFTFSFYGNDFTEFYVCSNGFVTFTSTSTDLSNDTIPHTAEPNNLMALFWDDLNPSAAGQGDVYYYNDGSRLIIEYDGVMRYGCTGCLYTMEIILYPNGKIIYQYKTMTGDRLDEATIGIENDDGTDGLEVVFNAEYMHDELAIRFSSAPAWLVFSPGSGTVPPGETDTIDVTFDATGILTGEFYGAFLITSNALKAVDTIPAHMTILVPDMTLSPDSIATSCNEGDGVQHQTLNIGNAGAASLTFNIVEGAPWLSVSPDAGTVNPGDPDAAIDLAIDCTDLYAGNYLAELEVYSNDPDFQPYATYRVYLQVGPDPDIDVTPDSFYVGIYAGYTKDTTMTISNTGDGHLVFGINIEETGKAGPDTILAEGFEGTFPPEDWLVVNNDGGTQEWVQYSSYSHTGSYCAACRWESGTLRNDDWLITPQLTVGANDTLTFWYRVYSTSFPESLEVRMSTTTSDLSSFTTVLWAEDGLVNTDWVEKKLELSKHAKGQIYIAFVYKGLDEFRIMVDDVSVLSYAGPWLAVNPQSDIVDPQSSMGVTVTFNATAVVETDKYANLWIVSNDPDEDPVKVPVHMAVLGPNYSVNPESLHIDALENAYTDGHIFVQNYGGHAPLAYKMTDPVDWLSESPDTTDVPMDTEQDVTVTVDGFQLIAGDYLTYIIIKTNDFDVPEDTIPVSVHVGPDPDIRVSPDSYFVQMSAGSIKDTTLTVVNDGEGTLAFEVSTEETGGLLLIGAPGGTYQERILNEVQKRNAEGHYKSAVTGTGGARLIGESNRAHLTTLAPGDAGKGGSLPGSPVMGKGDTVFIQLPHDDDEAWSFGTSDQGAGYKLCENFWGVTLPISDIHWWGLALIWTGTAWSPGNPANLVFDITFYSDPPGEIESPTEDVCFYRDVVPSYTYYATYAGLYDCYYFSFDLTSSCNLSEGWVSIESKSAGEGYDWLLWASAKTGDGVSCHVGGDCPRYFDQALILGGGMAWLTVTPEADTVAPGDSVDLDVTFDATELGDEDKFGNIILTHNAPDKGTTIVPVHLTFLGANYSVDPTQLVMAVNEGEYSDDYLDVQNFGGTDVLSYKMTPSDAWLTAVPDTEDVATDGYQTVTVTVDGNQLIYGDIEGYILVTTNDMAHATDSIPVFVHVEPPPDIDAPTKVAIGVIPGCTMEKSVRVSNLGLGHLGFVTGVAQAPPLAAGMRGTEQAKTKFPPAGAQIGKDGTSAEPRPQFSPQSGLGFGKGINMPKGDIIISEGFEGDWPPSTPPPGWTVIQTHTGTGQPIASYWVQTDYSVHSGTYAAGLWWDYGHQDEWLITPEVTLAGPCTLSFWTYGWEGSIFGDHYYVKVSTDGGSSWEEVFDLTDDFPPDQGMNEWAYPYSIGLDAYSGQTVKIAFHAEDPPDNDGLWYLWIIDDVTLESFAPPCPFTVSPEEGTVEPESFFDVVLTFDGNAFEQCVNDILTCYLVISSNDPDEPVVTVEVEMWSGRGDVFNDPPCVLDLGDVLFLINYVLKDGPDPDPVCMGDCNPPHDGLVDMEDVMYLIQYLYQGGVPPLAAPQIHQPSTPTPLEHK